MLEIELNKLLHEINQNQKTRCRESYIRIYHPEIHDKVSKLPGKKYSEKIYRYLFPNIKNTCLTCGKPTKFRSFNIGFNKFCSYKCSQSHQITVDKRKITCKEKYGDENYNNREKFIDTLQKENKQPFLKNREQFKKILKEKYGDENYNNREKAFETSIKNHGVKSVLCLESVRDIGKNVCENKYGVKYTFQNKNIRNKALQAKKQKFIDKTIHIIDILDSGKWICKCPHKNCNNCLEKSYEIYGGMYNDRKRCGAELCTKLNPPGSFTQTNIEKHIHEILLNNNIIYETNNRNQIAPKELDIYIPSKNIAIECNGCYWHSQYDKKYHINKYNMCKEKGIQLISIWEDWIINKKKIVESIILSKLGIYFERIGARQCTIKNVSSLESSAFLKANHIQGVGKNSIKIGLYYKNTLISLMCFSQRNGWKCNKNDWELTRFCTKLNTQVVGGANKLLKHFIKTYNPTKIISFSSNDISDGNLYKKLGFKQTKQNLLTYWYVNKKDYVRYHRMSFCKFKLKEMGYDTDNKTESEIMMNAPYYKIYDSGITGWELNIN